MDPNRTLSPADKMTAKEWHEAKADRRIKEAMYTALAEKLAYLDAVDLAVDMAGAENSVTSLPGAGLATARSRRAGSAQSAGRGRPRSRRGSTTARRRAS